jgi:ADP-heptose:LPS heptosyltransferase
MHRTLVAQLARFGDLVQTKRLLLSVAAREDCEAHLCVDSSLVGLARRLYPFAVVHGIPAHKASAGDAATVFREARTCFQGLRAQEFHKVILTNYSPLSFALAGLFEPEQLVGYSRPKGQPMKGKWASLAFNLMHDRRFAPLNLMDLWAFLHPRPVPPERVNPIPRHAGSGRVGIVMAGRESRRSLPPRELAACVQAIFQARGGPTLVCIGSRSERVLVHRLARELPAASAGKIEDRTGQTSLADLLELISGLDLVITPDTGTMHLAAHLGVPVQAFFLSSAWCFETGPYGFGHTVWQAVETCSPCRESAPCPRDVACLSPFGHSGFLGHLAGKYAADWPENLMGCISALDDLGVVYKPVDGDDPYADGRRELRNGLMEHLGVVRPDAPPPYMSQELAELLYMEKDWMLPARTDCDCECGL